MRSKVFPQNQKGFTHIFLLLAVVMVIGFMSVIIYQRMSNVPPPCEDLAQIVLDAKEAQYPLHRCELEEFKTEDEKTLTKVYVIAGEVEEEWEFECGFTADCSKHTGWFNDNKELISFRAAPLVADQDPAVQVLGCGKRAENFANTDEIQSVPILLDGEYFWKIEYDNFNTSNDPTRKPNCLINGTSFVGVNETRANLQAEYQFDVNDCSVFGPEGEGSCQIARTVINGGFEDCRYGSSIDNPLDGFCAEYYYSRTQDETICSQETSFGLIECSRLKPVNGNLTGYQQ